VTPAVPARPAAPSEDEVRQWTAQGVAAVQAGDFARGASLLERVVAARPGDAEGWNNLGVARVRAGDVSRGAEAFHRALALRPGHAEASRNLAVVLERQGRLADAIPHYRAYLASGAPRGREREEVERRVADLTARRESGR
jgi:Flp pilus assembly protein TadD